jgi:hypothetical protein
MAGRLFGLNLLGGLIQTYDSGGQLPLPGVMIGNERVNVGLAPDNDANDVGVDIFANIDNGTGPQFDGPGRGIMIDLDTNSQKEGLSIVGVDDGDGNIGSDLAVNGDAGQTADDSFLAVHVSGTEDDTVNGLGDTTESVPQIHGLLDGGVLGTGLLNFDDA